MKIELKAPGTCDDHPDGYIQLTAECLADAHRIGRMTKILDENDKNYTHWIKTDRVWVRLPLTNLVEGKEGGLPGGEIHETGMPVRSSTRDVTMHARDNPSVFPG